MGDPDLASLRLEYARGGLHESDLAADPYSMFRLWLDDAIKSGMHEPTAMVLATADSNGTPSARYVLLKGFSEAGFVFYTNSASRKGAELAANPRCALLFPWHPVERQVRVDGVARALPRDHVAAYFATRPRGAQLGAHASHQSRPVADRAELDAAFDEVAARFPEPGPVPLPEEWGGYVVRPEAVEFWQGRPGRMHDRLVYTATGDGWTTSRLAP